MVAEISESSIEKIQDELNSLTIQDQGVSSQYILRLSGKLDSLIAEYLEGVN
jgi:hypothetical protein